MFEIYNYIKKYEWQRLDGSSYYEDSNKNIKFFLDDKLRFITHTDDRSEEIVYVRNRIERTLIRFFFKRVAISNERLKVKQSLEHERQVVEKVTSRKIMVNKNINGSYSEIFNWLQDNNIIHDHIKGRYYFSNDNDAMKFKLAWTGVKD